MPDAEGRTPSRDDYGIVGLTDHAAHAIYDVLVAEVGANEGDRENFVYHQTGTEGCVEWRFSGSLGFGGKFWRNGSWYVNCYREDETAERDGAIERANARLADLYGSLTAPARTSVSGTSPEDSA